MQKITILTLILVVHALALYGLTQQGRLIVKPPSPVMQAVMIVTQVPSPAKPKVTPPPKPLPTLPKPQNLPVARLAPPSAKAITVPVNQTPSTPMTTVQAVEAVPVVAPVAAPIKEAIEEVTPPRSDARGLNNPDPNYPAMSKRLGEQGRVVLEVYILANGTVGEIKLKQSSGFKRLDDAAIQAVKKWHYQAARRGQQAIDFWYVQPVSFSLN